MSGIPVNLEEQLKELVAKGNKIAAVKLYRKETGVSLREAKEVVDTIALGSPVNLSVPERDDEPDPLLDNRIKSLLEEHKKIEAVKLYRETYNYGLKEAKDAVDRIQAEMRRKASTNLPFAPTINNDPFAEDTQRNRRFLFFVLAIIVLAIAGAAFFFLIGSGF
jgi:large subunit ribosomal protein L7/L12